MKEDPLTCEADDDSSKQMSALTDHNLAPDLSFEERIRTQSPETNPSSKTRENTIRYIRIGIAVFAVALALIIISPSMVHTAHADTLTSANPPYGSVGLCYDYGRDCALQDTNNATSCATLTTNHCGYTEASANDCISTVPCVTGWLYAGSNNNNGWVTEGVTTDVGGACPYSPGYIGTCPSNQGIAQTQSCCTLYVYADTYFQGDVTGSGTNANGFGTAAISLIWNIWGESRCYSNCGSFLYYWSWLTSVSDQCSVQGDTVGNPYLCTSPYPNPGASGYCNGHAHVECLMNSGGVLRDFDSVTVPGGYSFYGVTLTVMLWTESTNGSGGYAFNDFFTKGYVQIYDFGFVNPAAPNPPTLVYPGNKGAAQSPVDFQWNPVYDPSFINHYAIQIDTSPSFSNPVNCQQLGPSCWPSGTSTNFQWSLAQGTWYWRLAEIVGGYGVLIGPPGGIVPTEASAWTSANQFIVDNSPPNAVALTGPPSGAITNNNQPTLSWNAATDNGSPPSGIAGYVLEWDTSSAFSTSDPNFHSFPPFPYVYTGTSIQLAALSDGTWYWRVEAVDNAVNVGPWSSTWSFTVDTTPPSTPVLQSPSNGAVSTATTQTFTWSAATDDTGISGYNIEIDTTTSFNSPNRIAANGLGTTSYTATLSPGVWYWHVQAVDNAGNKGAWSGYNTLNIAAFTMSVSPSKFSYFCSYTDCPPPYSNNAALTITSIDGFSGTVSLTYTDSTPSSMPWKDPQVTGPSSATLTAGGTTTITVTAYEGTDSGTYTWTIQGQGGGVTRTASITISEYECQRRPCPTIIGTPASTAPSTSAATSSSTSNASTTTTPTSATLDVSFLQSTRSIQTVATPKSVMSGAKDSAKTATTPVG